MEREWSEEELNNTFSIYHDGAPAGWDGERFGKLGFHGRDEQKISRSDQEWDKLRGL